MSDPYQNFLKLKSNAGLHSPSIFELKNDLKIDIEIDACFLCNPYAFELFLSNFNKKDLKDNIKYYPPQNKVLSSILSKGINIDPDYLLVGNGAIQLIELIVRKFKGKKKCIVTPTFSTYYEYDEDNIVFFQTTKEENFIVDKQKLINFCKENKVEVLILVNPNNPTGTAFSKVEMMHIISELKDVNVIVDESFIDFYSREESLETEVLKNDKLIIIRSLSKDFGIAGLRLGYTVCNPSIKKFILEEYGLCWNINGLAQLFLELLQESSFQNQYELARVRYINERDDFYNKLSSLDKFKVYPSQANFFIINCFKNVDNVFASLLFKDKIYTRILNDKLHLDKSFLRIACGKKEENDVIAKSLFNISETF
jgi:histidinol-phosphate/aromatic aminotransferase/cobyric acid decarboxylase-like protein